MQVELFNQTLLLRELVLNGTSAIYQIRVKLLHWVQAQKGVIPEDPGPDWPDPGGPDGPEGPEGPDGPEGPEPDGPEGPELDGPDPEGPEGPDGPDGPKHSEGLI